MGVQTLTGCNIRLILDTYTVPSKVLEISRVFIAAKS